MEQIREEAGTLRDGDTGTCGTEGVVSTLRRTIEDLRRWFRLSEGAT